MKSGQQPSNPFILISMGLLIGISAGAGMVYYFFHKMESRQLSISSVQKATDMSEKKPEGAAVDNIVFQSFDNYTISESDKVLAVRKMIIPREENMRTNQVLIQLDSLIGKTREQSLEKNSILIVFYDSPEEQPGYIMSPKRLSFFGINDPDFTSIRLIEGVLYLEYMDHYFALQNTPRLRPLMPVRDQQSIADILEKWN